MPSSQNMSFLELFIYLSYDIAESRVHVISVISMTQ